MNTRIFELWQRFTQSSKHIRTNHQRESQLLNQIMLLCLQLVLLLLAILLILPSSVGMRGSFTIEALIIASTMLLIVFILNRLGFYYSAIWLLFSGASGIIYWNASVSSPPHLEIMYIILLPLISILILDLRGTIVLTLGTIIIFGSFQYVYNADITGETFRDLSLIIILTNILVIFVAYWRNRVEKERRELYLEQEKSTLIKELIANMSHDFKTPLAIINSSLYILEKSPDPLKRDVYIDKAKRQVWRLEGYIQDMLTILRLESNDLQKPEYIMVNSIISGILSELNNEIEEKQLRIECNLDENQASLLANSNDIYRMIQNLIKNAINYSYDTGQIRIGTYSDSDNLYLTINDNGIGIAENDTSLIFDRFYRADKARSLSTGGTGLGLAIVKRIVDLYNGQIKVESEINKGATFYITLPYSKRV